MPGCLTAPPRPWMPAVWDLDAQGLPFRHRPAGPHADLWESRCGRAWLFDFPVMRSVMNLRPCPECDAMDTQPPATTPICSTCNK